MRNIKLFKGINAVEGEDNTAVHVYKGYLEKYDIKYTDFNIHLNDSTSYISVKIEKIRLENPTPTYTVSIGNTCLFLNKNQITDLKEALNKFNQ